VQRTPCKRKWKGLKGLIIKYTLDIATENFFFSSIMIHSVLEEEGIGF
jgi:hypothetical protein